MALDSEERPARTLRRRLGLVAVVGVSLATMAPSMAININPQGMVPDVGPAVPLAFALATFGVLLVAYTFVRLSQRFDHSGSIYGQVGATLGPRPGVIAGWSLIGTYLMFGVVTSIAAGRFATDLLQSLGLWASPTDTVAYVIAIVLVLGAAAIGLGRSTTSTAVLVVVEAATVLLILIVTVVVLHRLATGQAPAGQTVDWSVLTVPEGVTASALFMGVTFGVLSFAGFEAATTLGEEAREPRRDIPRALLLVTVVAGVFFVFVSAVEVMGFGTSASGLQAFEESESLMGQLGAEYLSPWVGDLITVGALFSAVSCTLAVVVATSRLLYAYGRDGLIPGRFDELSEGDANPARAILFAAAVIIGAELVAGVVLRADSLTLFTVAGDTGVLLILVAYGLATIGMARRVFFHGGREVARWQLMIPIGALLLLAVILASNIWPIPTGSALWPPVLALAWLMAGVAVALRVRAVPASIAESVREDAERAQ